MTLPTSFKGLAVLSLVVAAATTVAGCDDTSGTGGSGTTSSGTQSTSSTGMATTGSMGTGSSSGTGVSPTAWETYCDARAALNCSPTFSAATCKMQQACATGFLKDAIEPALIDCLSKSCDEDACLAATVSEPQTSEGMNFSVGCQTWVTNCMASDDLCGGAYFLEDDDLMTLSACLSMGNCPMKQTCVDMYNATIDACEGWL